MVNHSCSSQLSSVATAMLFLELLHWNSNHSLLVLQLQPGWSRMEVGDALQDEALKETQLQLP